MRMQSLLAQKAPLGWLWEELIDQIGLLKKHKKHYRQDHCNPKVANSNEYKCPVQMFYKSYKCHLSHHHPQSLNN